MASATNQWYDATNTIAHQVWISTKRSNTLRQRVLTGVNRMAKKLPNKHPIDGKWSRRIAGWLEWASVDGDTRVLAFVYASLAMLIVCLMGVTLFADGENLTPLGNAVLVTSTAIWVLVVIGVGPGIGFLRRVRNYLVDRIWCRQKSYESALRKALDSADVPEGLKLPMERSNTLRIKQVERVFDITFMIDPVATLDHIEELRKKRTDKARRDAKVMTKYLSRLIPPGNNYDNYSNEYKL